MAGEQEGEGNKRATGSRTVTLPQAANDNGIAVTDDLPEILPIGDWELDLLEAHMLDILAGMIPANDNDEGTTS